MNHEYLSAQQFTSLIPKGWRQNSIPKLQYLLESIKPTEQKITEQERRWTEITGVLPKDTHVTIIVPIRNGGKYLAPMLHTLASADIPRSAHATFIFITNNCTDNGLSNHAVNSLLHTLGHVEKRSIDDDFPNTIKNKGVEHAYRRVVIDNTEFIHLDTTAPGKANALNLGSSIADLRNATAFCVDANTFVEPDAIAHMFRETQRLLNEERSSNIGLIMGTQKYDPLPKPVLPKELQHIPSLSNLSLKELLPVLVNTEETIPLSGSFMAWKPSFIQKIGGFPNVANEDGALVFKLRSMKKNVAVAENAITWEIRPQTLDDRRKTMSRLIRGWLQTIATYPEFAQDIRKLIPNMKDPETGLTEQDLLLWQKANPHIPIDAVPYIFELSKKTFQHGKEEYEANPKDIAW